MKHEKHDNKPCSHRTARRRFLRIVVIGLLATAMTAATRGAAAQDRFAVKRDTGPAKGLAAQAGLECLGQMRPRRSEEVGGSRWGLSCHQIADRHDLSVQQRLDHLAASGAKWALVCPSWNSIETAKGKYDWNSPPHRLDEVVGGLAQRGISPIMQIYGGNRLYTPFSPILPPDFTDQKPQEPGTEIPRLTSDPAVKQAWRAFLEALARRYCRAVKVWEVWNEPNISWFWKPKPDAERYGRMVREVGEVIKQVDPQATVLGGATAMVSLDFFQGLLRSEGAKSFDFASVHPYGAVPEQADGPVGKLRQLLVAQGRPAVLWQTECGFPSNADTGGWGYGEPWDETKHAKWVLRRMLCDASLEMRVSVYFTLHDCPSILEGGPDRGKMGINRKGLRYGFSWEPKPAAYTFSNVASLFDDRVEAQQTPVKVEVLEPGSLGAVKADAIRTWTLIEKNGRSPIVAYWMPIPMQTQAKAGRVRLRLAGATMEQPVVVDLLDGRVYRPRFAIQAGETTFENLPLADYPLVLCRRGVVEMKP